MNALGLDVTSVGNHEFDEGVAELLRLQNGGCHPTDGCQDGDGFAGADFPYLAANVVDKETGQPILPPYTTRKFVGGVTVGFVGMTLEGTPEHRQPGRHHHRRLPRRGGDRQQVRRPAQARRASRRWCCSSTRVASRTSPPSRRRTRPAAPTSPAPIAADRRGPATPSSAWSSPATPTAPTCCALPNSAGTPIAGRPARASAGAPGHRHRLHPDKRTGRFASVSART